MLARPNGARHHDKSGDAQGDSLDATAIALRYPLGQM
jgi:hypothetical protein